MSKYNTLTDTFVCNCGSLEHQFVFQIYDFGDDDWLEDDPEENVLCSLAVYLPDVPLWTRIKNAVKYVFGYKCRFGHFDSADIKDADVERLIKGLTQFRERVIHYRRRVSTRKEPIVMGQNYVYDGVGIATE